MHKELLNLCVHLNFFSPFHSIGINIWYRQSTGITQSQLITTESTFRFDRLGYLYFVQYFDE